MSTMLPPLPTPSVFFSLTAYLVDLERAQDIRILDLHYERLIAYLTALRDVDAIPADKLLNLQDIFAGLYRRQFRDLGGKGRFDGDA